LIKLFLGAVGESYLEHIGSFFCKGKVPWKRSPVQRMTWSNFQCVAGGQVYDRQAIAATLFIFPPQEDELVVSGQWLAVRGRC
jgi:hypothetical protein